MLIPALALASGRTPAAYKGCREVNDRLVDFKSTDRQMLYDRARGHLDSYFDFVARKAQLQIPMSALSSTAMALCILD